MTTIRRAVLVALALSALTACGSSPDSANNADARPDDPTPPADRAVNGEVTSYKGLLSVEIPDDWSYQESVMDSMSSDPDNGYPTDYVGAWVIDGTALTGTHSVMVILGRRSGDDPVEDLLSQFAAGSDAAGATVTVLESGTYETGTGYETALAHIYLESPQQKAYEVVFTLSSDEATLYAYLASASYPTDEAISAVLEALETVEILGAP